MTFFALLILLTLYFLPSIVALLRGAPDAGSVIVLNLFLGWTFLGWVISMAMAARSTTTGSINVNVSQQPGYGYAGVAYGGPQAGQVAPPAAALAPQLQQPVPQAQPQPRPQAQPRPAARPQPQRPVPQGG